ncbi:hypothetical protein BDV18DRAFT_163307 [Aspergillus unguis]
MRMRYCGFCGCPPYSSGLRKRSLAQPGDDEERLHDDSTCSCPRGSSSAPEEEHASDCDLVFGYDSRVLSDKETHWLDDVRAIVLTTEATKDIPAAEAQGRVFLTGVGSWDSEEGLMVLPGSDDPYKIQVYEDGFLVHDVCYSMLLHVHSTSAEKRQPFDLQRLFFTMRACEVDSGVALCWNDHRMYNYKDVTPYTNALETFQRKYEWRAKRTHEYLVTQPSSKINITQLISDLSQAINQQRTFISAPQGPGNHPACSLQGLPEEVMMMVMAYLPLPDMTKLFIADPRSHALAREYPNFFWKTRLEHAFPWLTDRQELQYLARMYRSLNYFAICYWLERASEPVPQVQPFNPMGPSNTNALRNQRRI